MESSRLGNSNESAIRLAELIWRTVKLRVSLLALTIVALLVVWSSLLNGNQEAQKIDTKFCEYLVESQNNVQKQLTDTFNKSLESTPNITKSQPILWSVEDQCHAIPSRTWIEITRNTDETMPLEIPLSPLIQPLDFMVKAAEEKRKAFVDYDYQRHAAYRLQIQLSSEYSGSSIIVNALTVARILPFCVFLVLAVVIVLGFQQSAYRGQLRALVRAKNSDELSEVMAETQFFAAPIDRDPSPLKRYLAVSPTDVAIGALAVAIVLLLVGIIWTFLLNLVQLTDSIVLSYPFALYASLVFLCGVLIITRKSYVEFAEAIAERHKPDFNNRLSKEAKWVTLASVVLAGISFALPWARQSGDEDELFRGFEFLLNQRPTGRLFNYSTFLLSPTVFRDVRIQVTLAASFLVLCTIDALFGFPRAKRIALFLYEIRRFLALCVLVLAVYYLFYMVFLEYESLYWVPWLDKLGLQGPAGAKGYSMLWYDPAYGFCIFLVFCFLLIWLSLATNTARLDRWIQRLRPLASQTWNSSLRVFSTRRHKADLPKPELK
jgi:hypothetical protein